MTRRLPAPGDLYARQTIFSPGKSTPRSYWPRPPGHHAEHDRAMGFCLFNHVAVAAAHLLANCGLERVLIIDWDVHHGNGTQHIFYDSDKVVYFSVHQFPFYPGTGSLKELGYKDGLGVHG